MEPINFWCRTCKIDVLAPAHTRVMNKVVGVVKEAQCPKCSGILRRYPQLVSFDAYFKLSRKTRIEARLYRKDILQVNDPLFNMYYPEHARKEAQLQEDREKALWKERHQ